MSDDERREVARRLRELASDAEEVSDFDLAKTLDLGAVSRYGYDPNDVERLADLIEPAPTSSDRGPTPDPTERGVDSIYDWCFERIEGADGAEDHLYCSILEGGQTRFSSHDGGIEGLAVVVDHRTGVQYLVTAAGACPLLDADGSPLLVAEAGE